MAPSRAMTAVSATPRLMFSPLRLKSTLTRLHHRANISTIHGAYISAVYARTTLQITTKQTATRTGAQRRVYSNPASTEADAVEPPDFLDENERSIFMTLKAELQPTELEVQDVSGGCGSMYAVAVTSERFKGLPMIKQHRLVNDILKERIKGWHGLQLKTKSP